MIFLNNQWISVRLVIGLMLAVMLVQQCQCLAEAKESSTNVHEYCVSKQPFEANCLKNEVIMMTSAIYGRMKMGHCLEDEGNKLLSAFGNDPQYLGCSNDVLHLMDKKCSGKNRCEIRATFDSDFENIKPCHAALKLYLEASYNCLKVIEEDKSCSVAVTSNPLHIMRSSLSSSKLGCGTKSQPWRLEAPAGQQINVSLLDFSWPMQSIDATTEQLHYSCHQYGYIIDKSAKKNISICALAQQRNKVIYRSHSNVAEIVLNIDDSKSDDIVREKLQILIGFQATGCSDIVPPDDTWLTRADNEAIVGCYSSRQTWRLRCLESQWVGVIGNCSRDFAELEPLIVEVKSSSFEMNQVIISMVILFLTIIICVAIICTGAVCLKRYYAKMARKNFHLAENSVKKHDIQVDRCSTQGAQHSIISYQ